MTTTSIQRKLSRGYERHIAGDTQTAAQAYAEILAADPTNADAWHLSGLIAFQKKQYTDAEQLIHQALKNSPGQISYQANLAAVLLAAGKPADAELLCHQILKRQPNNTESLKHLATAMRRQDRPIEAAEVLRTAVRLAPADADLLCNLGAVLNDSGQLEEALSILIRARASRETQPEIHLNLGAVQRQLAKSQDALQSLNRAIKLSPGLAEAFTNRGNLLLEMKQPDGAVEDYQRALKLNPQSISALSGLGQSLPVLGRWQEAIESVRLASQIAARPTNASTGSVTLSLRRRMMSNLLYCSSLTPGLTRRDVFEMHSQWGQSIESAITPFEHCTGRDPEKRLRIGYVSPDFRRHATMRFFEPFFESHDHEQFEIFAYSECACPDDLTARIRTRSDAWRSTHGLSDQAVAEQIHNDQIDILVDLAGHTNGNRLPSFAHRPAPVQATFLGYPNSTGMSRMDYLLADSVRENEFSTQYFSEQLVAMPHGACCFQPGDRKLQPSPPPCLSNGWITLGSTHRLEKLSHECLSLWAIAMQQNPTARLLLIRDVLGSSERLRDRLKIQLHNAGIDLDRVDLEWKIPVNHLEIYSKVDILLDVFPWPSGTTVYESLWMGVPMPSAPNIGTGSNASASCLHHVGCPDLIANSNNKYLSIVGELARDTNRLIQLRQSLRNQMEQTVCNGERFCRDLEAVFRSMWLRNCGMSIQESGLPLIDCLAGAAACTH